MSVVLTALKRDPHGHLAQGASRQRERPAQTLRAQDDVHAERTTLAHQAIEPRGRLLSELVFLGENS